MEPQYKRDLNHNYLVFQAGEKIAGESYEMKMLENNRLSGFLYVQMRRMDGSLYFYYDITAMQPLDKVFQQKPLNDKIIQKLLFAIKEGLDCLARYLLNPNGLVLEPEYIYLDQEEQIFLCYRPAGDLSGEGGGQLKEFLRLSEYILKKLDHDDSNAVMLGYELYNQASEENFSLTRVIRFAVELQEKEEKREEVHPVEEKEEPEYISLQKPEEKSKEKIKQPVQINKWLITIGFSLIISFVIGMIIFFAELSYTQTGGILFCLAAAACYVLRVSARKRRKTAEWVEEEETE